MLIVAELAEFAPSLLLLVTVLRSLTEASQDRVILVAVAAFT